jgi:murein DD-endopeptidase MepM/ murein hydrolase activator NlpD
MKMLHALISNTRTNAVFAALAFIWFSIVLAIFLTSQNKAHAYYFEGYYVPVFLVSPMKDNQVYTPAGMGVVTSRAGFRIHPVTGRGDFHSGVDLGAHLNDKVYNLLDGLVTKVGWRGNLGVAVEVYHPYPNIRTIMGHLNAYTVKPGMWVRRGQVVGYAGSTGRSTGVHVHYTVIKHDTNEYIEPMQYLLEVPKYVLALKTARARALAGHNFASFKKTKIKPKVDIKTDDDETDEDLPDKTKEAPPPDPNLAQDSKTADSKFVDSKFVDAKTESETKNAPNQSLDRKDTSADLSKELEEN